MHTLGFLRIENAARAGYVTPTRPSTPRRPRPSGQPRDPPGGPRRPRHCRDAIVTSITYRWRVLSDMTKLRHGSPHGDWSRASFPLSGFFQPSGLSRWLPDGLALHPKDHLWIPSRRTFFHHLITNTTWRHSTSITNVVCVPVAKLGPRRYPTRLLAINFWASSKSFERSTKMSPSRKRLTK